MRLSRINTLRDGPPVLRSRPTGPRYARPEDRLRRRLVGGLLRVR